MLRIAAVAVCAGSWVAAGSGPGPRGEDAARWPVWEGGTAGVAATCPIGGLWAVSSKTTNHRNVTVHQSGLKFTVSRPAADRTGVQRQVAHGVLSDSWSTDWDGVLSITRTDDQTLKGRQSATVTGRAAFDSECKRLRVHWDDGSVWCRGLGCSRSNRSPVQSGGGWPTPPPPPPWPSIPMELHIIEHTHDDVGWVKTIPEYYVQEVRTILDVATAGLVADSTRKFTYVEVAFFQLWWREQNTTWRKKVQKIVENGQLEFTSAGWCMSDGECSASNILDDVESSINGMAPSLEATSHFVDQVDQMTIGHLYLQSQFGRKTVVPTTGWQIDPFGHTSGTPFLFAKMGFNYFQFGRSPDDSDNLLPSAPDGNQFVWRPMASIADNSEQDLFTYYHMGYTSGPPDSCSNVTGCNDADMINYAQDKQSDLTNRPNCPVTLDLYGHDFAIPDYVAGDNVVDFFEQHPEYNITAMYSTPVQFYERMNQCDMTWEVFAPPNNDFFPYWTGFFTSQPLFKRMVRVASALFHVSRIIQSLHSLDSLTSEATLHAAQKLNVYWQSVGVVQHHDAVTGTSPPFTYVEYRERLDYGAKLAIEVVKELLGGYSPCLERPLCANNNDTNSSAQPHCIESEGPLCPLSDSDTMSIRLVNPLGWRRDDVVRFRLPLSLSGKTITVLDASGAMVTVQTTAQLGPHGEKETAVTFVASVPSLGTSLYTVHVRDGSNTGTAGQTTEYAEDVPPTTEKITLENGQLELTFDGGSGELTHVRNKVSGVEMTTSLGVRYYTPGWVDLHAYKSIDGTYDFATNDGLCRSFPGDTRKSPFTVKRGALYDELTRTVDPDSNIILATRLYHNRTDGFEVVLTVGPVDNSDMNGKDVILQWNTSITTQGRFYTDGSGLELMERNLGVGTFYQEIDPTRPGLNYYPTTILASISDAAAQLIWVSDRSQGCTSMRNGSLEKMVYRRLLMGDGKGMGVPLNSTDTMISTHQFLFDTPTAATSAMRPAAWRKYHPLLATTKSGSPTAQDSSKEEPAEEVTLPSNLLLQTFHVLSNDWDTVSAPYDIPPNGTANTPVPPASASVIPDGSVLIRLHHIFAVGEGTTADQAPASIDLGTLIGGRKVKGATELSLSAAQDLDAMSRLKWKTGTVNTTNTTSHLKACIIDRSSGKLLVTVTTMDICTYALQLE